MLLSLAINFNAIQSLAPTTTNAQHAKQQPRNRCLGSVYTGTIGLNLQKVWYSLLRRKSPVTGHATLQIDAPQRIGNVLNAVTSFIRIKNAAGAALVVAALCTVAFSAVSLQPENDAQAQNAKRIIVSTPTAATEGGTNGSLTVKLSAEPSGEVDVDIKSTDTGALQLNANDPNATTGQTTVSLDFNANNYSTPQTVYLVAQSDTDGANESVTLEVEPESDPLETVDPDYRALEKFTVSAPVNDDDQIITFNLDSSADDAAACSTLGSAIDASNLLIVNEEDENNYCVRLGTHPSNQQNGEPKQWADAAAQAANPVTVNISSDNTDITVSPATLNFTGDLTTAGDTSGTWRVAQSVVVSAKDDKDVTPDTETATLSHAATGGGYSLGADETDSQITVTVRDNDPGIAITEMTEGGFVLEDEQAPDVFRVSLTTQDTDTSNVTVTISEVIADGATSQLSSGTLVFDNSLTTFTSNIGITRTVSFTTADDDVAGEAYSPLKLKITASDDIAKTAGGYGLASDPTTVFVDMTIVDDDRKPGVTINPTTLNIDEGKTKAYTVVLDAAPTNDPSTAGVQINMAIKDNKGGIFIDADASTAGNQQTIEFRSGNPGVTDPWNRWFMPRTVTVIAATDADASDDLGIIIGHTITQVGNEALYTGVTKGLVDVTVNVTDTTPKDLVPADPSGQINIRKITPSVKSVTVSAGDTVRLMVNVYALDNNLLQKLADAVEFDWTANGVAIPGTAKGANDPHNAEISYTAPSSPGTYIVKAKLAGNECLYTGTGDDYGKNCEAEFEVKVRRSAPAAEPTAVPVNPLGEIPDIISGNDGKQYEVFTPEEGGTFDGDSHSITAGSGIVPSGEYIGVRMDGAGSASNAGMTAHRYTLVGDAFTVSVADSAGEAINSYALNGAAKVCLPLPAAARSNISDIALVVKMSDGSLQVLSGTVRIAGAAGPDVCGHVSSIPATVAVGTAGAPAAFTPTPEPTSTPEPPETGGTAPSNGAPLALILLLGIATAAIGTFLLTGRRRGRQTSR